MSPSWVSTSRQLDTSLDAKLDVLVDVVNDVRAVSVRHACHRALRCPPQQWSTGEDHAAGAWTFKHACEAGAGAVLFVGGYNRARHKCTAAPPPPSCSADTRHSRGLGAGPAELLVSDLPIRGTARRRAGRADRTGRGSGGLARRGRPPAGRDRPLPPSRGEAVARPGALLQTCRRGESDQDDNRAFVMFLRWPDGPVTTPWPRSGRTVRDRRRARRSGPRRQCRPGGQTSRPGPCAARASPRSP